MEKQTKELKNMNERELLFESIKSQRGESEFSRKEINDESYRRMKELVEN